MLYIDFIDTETGKQVFKEGKIIEAQNGILDTIQLRFYPIPESNINIIKEIGDLKCLRKLRKHAVNDQSKDEFINHLLKYVPEKKWRKTSKKSKRGTDEAFFGLAPFTVPTDMLSSSLTAYGREWKKTIITVYDMTNFNDAINVMSLFILNRFRGITREGIKAMLDFDYLKTLFSESFSYDSFEHFKKRLGPAATI